MFVLKGLSDFKRWWLKDSPWHRSFFGLLKSPVTYAALSQQIRKRELMNTNKQIIENAGDTLSVAAYVAFIFTTGSVVYKTLNHFPPKSYTFEIALLCLMTFSIFAHRIVTQQYNLPFCLFAPPTAPLYKRDFKQRAPHYLMEAMVFSLIFITVALFLLDKPYVFTPVATNKGVQLLFDLCVATAFSFVANLAWFEFNIYKYEQAHNTAD